MWLGHTPWPSQLTLGRTHRTASYMRGGPCGQDICLGLVGNVGIPPIMAHQGPHSNGQGSPQRHSGMSFATELLVRVRRTRLISSDCCLICAMGTAIMVVPFMTRAWPDNSPRAPCIEYDSITVAASNLPPWTSTWGTTCSGPL
jgi:hypothetical protein